MKKIGIIGYGVVGKAAENILGTEGCMQQGNTSFNNLATVHVDSLCAALSYGCTDPTALNYNEPCMTLNNAPCTAMCPEIAADLCCTKEKLGCKDRAANNFDPTANPKKIVTILIRELWAVLLNLSTTPDSFIKLPKQNIPNKGADAGKIKATIMTSNKGNRIFSSRFTSLS